MYNLCCSTDYLLDRTDNPNTDNQTELEMFAMYRELSVNDKQDVFDYVFGKINVFDCMLGGLLD